MRAKSSSTSLSSSSSWNLSEQLRRNFTNFSINRGQQLSANTTSTSSVDAVASVDDSATTVAPSSRNKKVNSSLLTNTLSEEEEELAAVMRPNSLNVCRDKKNNETKLFIR